MVVHVYINDYNIKKCINFTDLKLPISSKIRGYPEIYKHYLLTMNVYYMIIPKSGQIIHSTIIDKNCPPFHSQNVKTLSCGWDPKLQIEYRFQGPISITLDAEQHKSMKMANYEASSVVNIIITQA